MGTTGLEPAMTGSTDQRSSQLSYMPGGPLSLEVETYLRFVDDLLATGGHIFDCYNSLTHFVRANDNDFRDQLSSTDIKLLRQLFSGIASVQLNPIAVKAQVIGDPE